MSGYPLLHPSLTPARDWSDQGASLDSDEWVSTPPSWSDSLHHYQLDQGHVWTCMSGYPLLHPGLTPAQDWLDQRASLNSEEWVSTPPAWSDSLHHYQSDQRHVWTHMSGCPLLHPGPMVCTTTGQTRCYILTPRHLPNGYDYMGKWYLVMDLISVSTRITCMIQ